MQSLQQQRESSSPGRDGMAHDAPSISGRDGMVRIGLQLKTSYLGGTINALMYPPRIFFC